MHINIVQTVVLLIILSLVWWLIDTQIPIPETFKMVIKCLVVLALIVWLLQIAGMVGPIMIR